MQKLSATMSKALRRLSEIERFCFGSGFCSAICFNRNRELHQYLGTENEVVKTEADRVRTSNRKATKKALSLTDTMTLLRTIRLELRKIVSLHFL